MIIRRLPDVESRDGNGLDDDIIRRHDLKQVVALSQITDIDYKAVEGDITLFHDLSRGIKKRVLLHVISNQGDMVVTGIWKKQ